METIDILKEFDLFKEEIKELAKSESSLKSISFTKPSKENKILTCYFAWKSDFNLFQERICFRESVKALAKKHFLLMNRKVSTSAKFIFEPFPEQVLNHLGISLESP